MNVMNYDIDNRGLFRIINIFLILITLGLLIVHFVFETFSATKPTWGVGITYLNIIQPITSLNLFYILTILALFVFLVGLLLFNENPSILGLNQKQVNFIGFILYFLGILSYFNFQLFEPFLLLYLVSVGELYFFLIKTPISPFYQPTYTGFDILYTNFTPWDGNTKAYIQAIFTTQNFDLVIILLIVFLFVLLTVTVKSKGKLLSEETILKIQRFTMRKVSLNGDNVSNLYVYLAFLFIQQYVLLFIVLIFVNNLAYFYILVTLLYPIAFRNHLKIPIKKLYNPGISLNMSDVYLANIFIISIFLTILQVFNLNFGIFIVIFVAALFIIKNRPRIRVENEFILNFTVMSFYNMVLFYVGILYIVAWSASSPSEGFFLSLVYYLILIRLSPFLIRSIMSPGVIKFSIRRILLIIPMFVGVSIITYGLIGLTGDPINIILQGACRTATSPDCKNTIKKMLQLRFGLDSPVYLQWFHWLMHFVLGDAGQSIFSSPSVTNAILARFGPTLEIVLIPSILSLLIAIPLGILASNHQNSFLDDSILIFVAVGVALPIFVFIIFLMLLLTANLQILPNFGRSLAGGLQNAQFVNLAYAKWFINGFPLIFNISLGNIHILDLNVGTLNISSIFAWDKWDWVFHIFIQIFAITILGLAFYTRLVRGGMLEIMRQDFILSARASGFSENVIIRKYALRNVMVPVITFFGISIGSVLGGAPITETVLSWPGLGLYALQGVLSSDYAVIMATTMIIALMILFANLFTDILYSMIDPRIRIE